MCEIVGIVLSAASTILGGIAQYQQQQTQAEAARNAANYNAQVAANEAETQRNLAMAELQKGAEERSRRIRAGATHIGEQAAGMGASGFTLDQGTTLSLLGQSAEEIQHDISIGNQNTAMNAWSRLAGANKAENDKGFFDYQARTAANQGGSGLGLAGTVLGGIGQGLTGYYQYKKSGTPG